ncbi:MAG: DUF3786 domain-containing protein [Candidatus Bipolaricaulia bacterium]
MEKWRESLRPRITEARAELQGRDPAELAELAGAEYREGELRLRLFDKEYRIPHPELVAYEQGSRDPAPEELQALLLDYLRRADGTPPTGEWLAFRELDHGQFYYRAFQGYSGDSLAREIGNDLEGFRRAAGLLGGKPLEFGDASFEFEVLPHLRMALVYWQGDEEFPPRASVLFDAAAARYLPTGGLAILGRWLCAKLVKLRGL